MNEEFSTLGGVQIGLVHASWPLARITASPSRLRLSGLLGAYEFRPGDVVSLEAIPLFTPPSFSSGVRIVHARSDFPVKMMFLCFSPENTIKRIRGAGFAPSAARTSEARWRGLPMRWSVLVAVLLSWIALFRLLDSVPIRSIPPSLIALLLAFLVCRAVQVSPAVQKLVLNDGHSVNEIKPHLLLVQSISGLLLVLFTLMLYTNVIPMNDAPPAI